MQVRTAYYGSSAIRQAAGSRILQFAPDLSRDRVAFDAPLKDPVRFREAISALHDVVINDLRFKPRDKSGYQLWKENQRQREAQIRSDAVAEARRELEARRAQPIHTELRKSFELAKGRYWKARRGLNDWLRRNDPNLWRLLMPYDPIITVADDVVFFECFSADESSYGCLTANREDCFGPDTGIAHGTTNVDYSWNLYDSFQSLRSYRETRFSINPEGFAVATKDSPDYHEEKIDLPDGWLRGFMQLQSAMCLPMRKVSLSVASVYSLLAFLKRRKARTSPRAIRFELREGQAPRMVLEPWEQPIDSHGAVYSGPVGDPIRIWGRRRLLVLSRLLPLAEGVDVYLLGTGLPSFWVVRMGAMRLTLGLSGWTTNDWTRGSAVDMLMAPVAPDDSHVARVATELNQSRRSSLRDLSNRAGVAMDAAAASLNQLALRGQVIHDLDAGCYRWRQALPMALSEREFGPPHPERAGAMDILGKNRVQVQSAMDGPRGGVILVGKAENQQVEALIDDEGIIRKGKCLCGYHYKYGIRNGPCRHIQALRDAHHRSGGGGHSTSDWYDRMRRWATGEHVV
ncbi:MAG TPA: metal-binding protein [Phycisphaerae bacterium]|nr:metal-binding protein [Phycisphaerae bacterium]HRW54546.1 metal-binding protein [Phycisphaerae bacterium]